jgi:hypothetical protein
MCVLFLKAYRPVLWCGQRKQEYPGRKTGTLLLTNTAYDYGLLNMPTVNQLRRQDICLLKELNITGMTYTKSDQTNL